MKVHVDKQNIEPIYGMANFKEKITGEKFDLWVDEVGSDRNVVHNLPRFKPKANGVQLDIVLNPNGDAEIVNADSKKIQKFRYAKEAIAFIERFRKPLMMHWNGEIETTELGNIIRLVVKKNYTIDNAITSVLNDEY